VQSGGLRVNDQPVSDAKAVLTTADVVNAGAIKLSFGKKKHVLLKLR
jgi:tyrosyl-tRNA synthetase